MLIKITVAAGYGEAEFDHGGWGCDASIQPPDATPTFDFMLVNRRGDLILGAVNITDVKPKIEGRYKTSVHANTVIIANAADDGVYEVELHLR